MTALGTGEDAPVRPQRGARAARPPRAARRPTADDGLVIVDKPAGWTSHDVVARMRGIAGTRKVGHAGTLDPMATGVLVLGIGRATRLLTYVVGADKEYTATIRLGVSTNTDDAEGEVVAVADAAGLTRAQIDAGVAALTGPLEQVPSTVSAIKVDGQRAYARARAGETFELAARPVTIVSFAVHDVRVVALPGGGGTVVDVDITVVCTSGTYIRALARDLGAGLGVGGHLTALRRTRVGGYPIGLARTLDELEAHPDSTPLDVLPLAAAARATFPVRELTAAEATALSFGQRIRAGEPVVGGVDGSELAGGESVGGGVPGSLPTGVRVGSAPDAGHASAPDESEPGASMPGASMPGASMPVAAIAPDGTLVALLETSVQFARPVLVFAPA